MSYYFYQLDPYYFDYFLLLKLFFFSISHFNKKIIFIPYINFDSHSFNYFLNLFIKLIFIFNFMLQ